MALFFRGDTLTVIQKNIQSKSINLIYIDPPFGTTQNYWDSKQDWKQLFKEFFRILKDDGMIVIHCSIPFNYELIRAAPKPPLYSWYWKKDNFANPLIANKQPLRDVEEILVWKKKKTTYYRQNIGDDVIEYKGGKSQYTKSTDTDKVFKVKGKTRTHFIEMSRNTQGFSTRPDDMVKLMIDSYSKKGDTILDCYCYKGLSYKHSKDRKWIGIDKFFMPDLLFHNL